MELKDEELRIPQAGAAEHALVNLAINNPDLLNQMVEMGITGDMFYDHFAAFTYNLFVTLTEEARGAAPSQINIRSKLKAENKYEELAYYTRLYEEPQSREYFERNLSKMITAYKKREVLRHISTLALMCADDRMPFDTISSQNQNVFNRLELFGQPISIKNGETLKREMQDYYDTAGDQPKGNDWGIRAIDGATKGTRLGELTLVKGLEGSGKSALLQQTAFWRANQEKPRPQLWITIGDMTATQIMNRIMQQEVGVPANLMAEGVFTDRAGYDRRVEVDRTLSKLPGIPFYILEGPNLSSSDLKRVIRGALRLEETFDVYIDYLQQLRDPGEAYEATNNISHNLLDCAHNIRDKNGRFSVSVTAISGMNTQGKHFGAQRLAHDAENIFEMEMEKVEVVPGQGQSYPSEKKAWLKIEKQRNGPKGIKLNLCFEGKYTRFSDAY